MEEKKQPGIRAEYDPSDEEKKKIQWVYDRKQDMEQSPDRVEAAKVWDKGAKAWEGYREEKGEGDWQSNHYVPITTAIVETALAEMVDQTPRPLILPRSSEDSPKATIMKHIFEYTWEVSDGDTQLYNVMKDTLIFGTAIAQEYYWQDRRIVKQIKLDKKGEEREEEIEVFDYDDAVMEVVKLEDFFIDEKARGFDGPYGARDCIRRYIMNIEDCRLFFKGKEWDQFDNVKYVKAGGDVNYFEWYKPPQGIDTSKEVEVLWYWSKREDFLRIVANDVLIKDGPNPYAHKQLPFARSVDVKRPHRFYGKGEPELLESIQDEANTLRRMMIDRNHLDIDKGFMVSDSLNLNDEDLIVRPHMMIPTTGDVNTGIKSIEYGDTPRSIELGYNLLEGDSINVTGIDPRAAAAPQPRTATEAALLKEAALKKIRMKLRLLEREFLVRVGRLRISNIVQFYSQPTLELIVGKKGSADYKAKVAELQNQGALQRIEGEDYQESYRQIRLQDKEMQINEEGMPIEMPIKGFSFFEANPKVFVPAARGGFDIRFAAGATLPISKPLMQTKATEMYDRLIQLALAGVGYDPVALGDMLLEVNDFEPEDFKKKEDLMGQGQDMAMGQDPQQMMEMAQVENQEWLQGNPIPPTGTPLSTPEHTQAHVEFMYSPEFQETQFPDEQIQVLVNHIMGELMAQQSRGEEQPIQGQPTNGQMVNPGEQRPSFQGQGQQFKPPQGGGSVNNQLGAMMPNLFQGGANSPL